MERTEPLKLLFVINNLYTRGNGLSASARRTITLLRERGHDVRAVSYTHLTLPTILLV